jgi:hypothetical protein
MRLYSIQEEEGENKAPRVPCHGKGSKEGILSPSGSSPLKKNSLLSPPQHGKKQKRSSLDEETISIAKKQASNLFELGL